MKQPNQIFVRRAGPKEPIELVINRVGYPETYVLTLGQAKNMAIDLQKMLFSDRCVGGILIPGSPRAR